MAYESGLLDAPLWLYGTISLLSSLKVEPVVSDWFIKIIYEFDLGVRVVGAAMLEHHVANISDASFKIFKSLLVTLKGF
jgi:hypothetical protein